MKTTIAALACALIASGGVANAQSAPPVFGLAPCTAAALTLSTSGENGAFNGMSHSGTRVILRNTSENACTLAPASAIALHARGSGVRIVTDVITPFDGPLVNGHRLPMGHGPVVLPIVLTPGAVATADVRWVSSAVYDRSVCVTAAAVSVALGDAIVRSPIAAHICGADAGHVTVQAHRFVAG